MTGAGATASSLDIGGAARALGDRLGGLTPRVAVVLGSGLSHLADRVEEAVSVPFDTLPGLPPSGVVGHTGSFVAGRLAGVPVVLQAGRYHGYEGHPMEVVVAPVRILAAIGVQVFVFTNAAGGIHPTSRPGDLYLLDDHINLMFRSPLAGAVAPSEQRFPDMSAPYDPELQRLARIAALAVGVELERGVYAAVLGPAFETAAEVRMIGELGADLVGMSTVPEVITARAAGLRCVAFSMVTNQATGLGGGELHHGEVLEVGREAGARLGEVITRLVTSIAGEAQSTGTK